MKADKRPRHYARDILNGTTALNECPTAFRALIETHLRCTLRDDIIFLRQNPAAINQLPIGLQEWMKAEL